VLVSALEGGPAKKSKISLSDRVSLTSEIAALAEATTANLKAAGACSMAQPPPRISRDLLTRALAYRMQEVAVGGLKRRPAGCWCKLPPLPRREGPSRWQPR
jgi:Protein of unknown function (DUF2924)